MFGYKYRDADAAPPQKGFFARQTPAPKKALPPTAISMRGADPKGLIDYISSINAFDTPVMGSGPTAGTLNPRIFGDVTLEVTHPRTYGSSTGPR